MRNLSLQRKLRSLFIVSVSGFGTYGVISFFKNNEVFYKNVIMPAMHFLEPEKTHKLAVALNKYRLLPKSKYVDPESLKVTVFGKVFKNPIGIAAGFDKDGEAVLGLRDIGFGHIEIGSVTPKPQPGNERPRVFRLSEDQAVINRYGFNSEGHDTVFERLKRIRNDKDFDGVVGVNLGKNKTSSDPIKDYILGVEKFAPLADYLVINISSPNTPGLRAMQNKNTLRKLLQTVITTLDNLPLNHRPPLLLKLAPDLSFEEKKDIADVIQDKKTKVDGLIICNTTTQRPHSLSNHFKNETGGLSGKPLKNLSTEMITDMFRLTKGRVPIIGVGGVFTGSDAYEKIKAGACMVQIYTSMVYEGPPVVTKIKRELNYLLNRDGYESISEAVGVSVKK